MRFFLAKGGPLFSPMPKNLKRIIGRGDLHFITFCCYQRRPLLASARARNLAVQILKEVRARYGFALVGYVIMPEHLHLLISESASVAPSKIIQVFKQRLSRRMRARKRTLKGQLRLRFPEKENLLRRFWQRRYYDFNVYSRTKVLEKLHYIHSNRSEKSSSVIQATGPGAVGAHTIAAKACLPLIRGIRRPRRSLGNRSKEKKGPPFAKGKTAKGRPPRKVLIDTVTHPPSAS